MSEIRETLPGMPYRQEVWNPSQIDPGQTVRGRVWYTCPRVWAGGEHSELHLEPGDQVTCVCGLKVTLAGTALECVMQQDA